MNVIMVLSHRSGVSNGMRRSYATSPPRMNDDHPYWHSNDRRYSKLSDKQLEQSRAESLKDAALNELCRSLTL